MTRWLLVPLAWIEFFSLLWFSARLDRQYAAKANDGDAGYLWAGLLQFAAFGLLLWSILGFLVIPHGSGEWWMNLLEAVVGAKQVRGLALFLPFAAAVAATVWLSKRPGDPSLARWIAGSITDTDSRAWLALMIVGLAFPWIWLGGLGALISQQTALLFGTRAFSISGLWSWEGVFLIALWRISKTSARRAGLAPELVEPELVTVQTRDDWAAAMDRLGVDLELLRTLRGGGPWRPVLPEARGWAAALAEQGLRHVAPALIERIASLVSWKPGAAGQPLLMLGLPDESGEVETVAMAAARLAQDFSEATLLIVPRRDPRLVARLARWCGLGPRGVVEVDQRFEAPAPPGIWVVDAETLSDWLIEKLADSHVASSIGLVVWWALDRYTGVFAANLWAISRRLDRLLQERGRIGLRTLALVRQSPHADAQETAFVAHLLPYPFPADAIVQIEPRMAREVRLYQLRGHARYFAEEAHQEILPRIRHREFVAARVSTEALWPTFLHPFSECVAEEWENFLDLQVSGKKLRESLSSEAQFSGAEIRRVENSEVLTLRSIFANAGRSDTGGQVHCVGILPPENPYAAYVLSSYATPQTQPASSRRMVGSEGNPFIYDRHLLLALNEMGDTESGLIRTLRWERGAIRQTLERHRGQLQRSEVSYLDESRNRQIESLYKLGIQRTDDIPPLDTVGSRRDLVFVVHKSGGQEAGGVRMVVDAARVPIRAYPGCVFYSNGTRYRVSDWLDKQEFDGRWIIPCGPENEPTATWRNSWPSVSNIRADRADKWTIDGHGFEATCSSATVTYSEHFFGYLNRKYNVVEGTFENRMVGMVERDTSFDTRALLLTFHSTDLELGIDEMDSLALALRHVLPVHFGVEADALEVVTIDGVAAAGTGETLFGVAIVDLYPGGIGLVEAVQRTGAELVVLILRSTAQWLASLENTLEPVERSPLVAIWKNQDMRGCLPVLSALVGQPVKR